MLHYWARNIKAVKCREAKIVDNGIVKMYSLDEWLNE